jgi:hypothetical protein
MVEGMVREPGLRIVSGPCKVVEAELNRLLVNYAVMVWNFAVVDGEQHVTAVLVHQRELRKMQLAQPMMGNAHR